MEIAAIIVGGLVLMTIIPMWFVNREKRLSVLGSDSVKRLESLEKEVAVLASSVATKDERIEKLESELGFLNKLIEDKGR